MNKKIENHAKMGRDSTKTKNTKKTKLEIYKKI